MKAIYVALFTCLIHFGLSAQSNFGTEFWLAYMENLTLQFNDEPVFAVHVSSETAAQGQLSVPATGFTVDFTVDADDVTEILLPQAIWYSETSEVIENKGIKISTDVPVRVEATHFRLYFTEATGVLPTAELGTDYLPICQIDAGGNGNPSSFVVLATQDDTEIEITPSQFTLGLQPAEIPFNITLDEGQIFQVQSAAGDLTGSHVRSLNGEAIAVFSGAQQANIGNCSGGADNHLWEQSIPTTMWGTTYYHVPFSGQGGDEIKIVATEDNTTVFFDCNEAAVLNSGEFFSTVLFNPTVITATSPVAVSQTNQSQSCNASGIGDPSTLNLIPTRNMTTWANWEATQGATNSLAQITSHFSNVITLSANTGDILLDGTSIQAEFTPFPADQNFSYAQVSVSAGTHNLSSSSPFHVYHYGFGDFDAYTKSGAYQTGVDAEYVCLDIEAEGIFCVDSLIQFNPISNFAITNYLWETSEGETSMASNPVFSFTEAGAASVSLTVTTTTGQQFSADYDLTIQDCSENPCDEDVLLNISIDGNCAEEAVSFFFVTDVNFVSISWDFGDNSGTSSQESPNYIYQTPGIYLVSLSIVDELNCTYTTSQTLEVLDCEGCGDEEVFISTNTEICAGNDVTFFAEADFLPDDFIIYEWQFSTGEFFVEPEPTLNFSEPGTYTVDLFLLNIEFDCDYEASLVFQVVDCENPCEDLPPVSIVGASDLCVEESEIILAETAADLQEINWFLNGTPIASGAEFNLTAESAGVFVLSLVAFDAFGCEYLAETEIIVEDCDDPCGNPFIAEILSSNNCAGETTVFSIESDREINSFNWIFSTGISSQEAEPNLTFEEAGLYLVSVTLVDSDGCIESFTEEVEITDCSEDCILEPGDISVVQIADLIICSGDSLPLSLHSEIEIGEVTWTVNGTLVLTGTSVLVPIEEAGSVSVLLEVPYGDNCIYTETLDFNFGNCTDNCRIFVPDAFSPNDDLNNDFFRVFSNCEPDFFEFRIYNRWGALLVETNDFSFTWGGFFRSQTAPTGVYAWTMRYRFEGQSEQTESGNLTLVR